MMLSASKIPKTLVIERIKLKLENNLNFTNITFEFFINIVEVIFETIYLMFDDKFFHLKDGKVMGNLASFREYCHTNSI